MQTVDGIAKEIVRVEGGLVDDPDDNGGITNHGVSLRYAKGIGLDLDGDGDTDADDIRLVTPDVAVKLFKEDFFYSPRIHSLPEELHAQMFDFGVNSGPPRAIMTLQLTLNQAAPYLNPTFQKLDVDGVMGKRTRLAAESAQAQMGGALTNALAENREKFLRGLAERNPSQMKYIVNKKGGLGGWIVRARSFRV